MKETETEQVDRQACEWLSIMNSDRKSDSELVDFRAWLEADAEHRAAYDQASSLWSDLEDLRDVYVPSDYQVNDKLTLWQKTALAGQSFRTTCIQHRSLQFGIAASVLLATYILWPYLVSPSYNNDINGEYATQTAELRDIRLNDGSTVTLGALSAIEVKYSDSERRVELVSGDAFFSVTKNPNRPFIVATTNAEIRVVGTKFDVRRSSKGIRISVLEGLVEVSQNQAGKIDGVMATSTVMQILSANQELHAGIDINQARPRTIENVMPGAWREGRLIYENVQLAVVISDADRYYSGNIIIDSADLEDLLVSASFRTDQINEMMDTLSAVLPISVRRLSNGDIVLRRREIYKT